MDELTKEALEGIELVNKLTEEEELQRAATFAEAEGSPIHLLWLRIFKEAMQANYWLMSHLPKTLDPNVKTAVILDLSGRITELERLLSLPAILAENADEINGRRKKKK